MSDFGKTKKPVKSWEKKRVKDVISGEYLEKSVNLDELADEVRILIESGNFSILKIPFRQEFSPLPSVVTYQLTDNENGVASKPWDAGRIITSLGIVITGTDYKPIYDGVGIWSRTKVVGAVDTSGEVTLNVTPSGDFIVHYYYQLQAGEAVEAYTVEDILRPPEVTEDLLGTNVFARPDTPSNYTPVPTGSESIDKISAHLKGIDTFLGSHTHNDLYYLKTEVDTLLLGKAAVSHTHLAAHITDLSKSSVGLGNVTNDAQLKRTGNDFTTFTEKTSVVGSDILLIEDSSDSNNKKYVQISNLPSSGGSTDASSILGVAVDDSNIADGRVLQYVAGSPDSLEYVDLSAGSDTSYIILDCDTSVAVNDLVYASNSTDNFAVKATDNKSGSPVIGVVIEKIDSTTAKVQTTNEPSISYTGLTLGKKVFVSSSGVPTTTVPTGGYLQVIGVCKDINKVFLNISYNRVKLNPF